MTKDLSCWVPDSFVLAPTGSGILDGKTFALKDCFSVKGHISSFGHPAWRATHKAAEETAPVVKTLLANGARMAGLAKMDQLAYSLVGDVGEGIAPLNPLYPDRFTGGSSSGPASAVAGGLADIGIGTDTVGSMRVPAAACGLYGIRPTHDRIDTTGVLPWAPSYDVVSLISKSAALLSQAFSLLTQQQRQGPIRRILIAADSLDRVEPAAAKLVTQTAEKLAGLHAVEVEPFALKSLSEVPAGDIVVRSRWPEIWPRHGKWITEHLDELAPEVAERARQETKQLAQSSEEDKRQAQALRSAYRQQFNNLMQPGTVIVMPVLAGLPPKRDASPGELLAFRKAAVAFNSAAGLSGTPQVVVPVQDNLSDNVYGVGLLGARGDDELLLEVAKQIAQVHIDQRHF